jgi:hypothetical protein
MSATRIPRWARWARWALLAPFLLGWGCAHTRGPEDAARAWIAAVDRDDPAAAYALLSTEVQREVPKEQFLERWRANREAARMESPALRQGIQGGAVKEARILYGEGLWAELALERPPSGATWRLLDVPTPRTPHVTTPERALEVFIQQLSGRDWDAISKLMTPATREAVDKDLRERMRELKEAGKIEINGEKGHVRVGRLELILERTPQGDWVVVGLR